MEVGSLLDALANDSGDLEAFHVAGARHNQRQAQQGDAEQREQCVLIDAVLVVGVVGEFALQNLHASQPFDVPLDGGYCLLVASASILHSHGDDRTGHDARKYHRDGVVVDFCHVVYQVIAFVHRVQTVLVDEPDELGKLVGNELLGVVDVAPHNEVFGDDLKQDVVGVALLNRVKAVRNGDLVAHVPVVRLEVHQAYC